MSIFRVEFDKEKAKLVQAGIHRQNQLDKEMKTRIEKMNMKNSVELVQNESYLHTLYRRVDALEAFDAPVSVKMRSSMDARQSHDQWKDSIQSV
jgi:hypothetical protein